MENTHGLTAPTDDSRYEKECAWRVGHGPHVPVHHSRTYFAAGAMIVRENGLHRGMREREENPR